MKQDKRIGDEMGTNNVILLNERKSAVTRFFLISALTLVSAIALFAVYDDTLWGFLGLGVSLTSAIFGGKKFQQMKEGMYKRLVFLGEHEHGIILELDFMPHYGSQFVVKKSQVVSEEGMARSEVVGKTIKFVIYPAAMPTRYGELHHFTIG